MSKLDNVIRIKGNVGQDPEFSKAGQTDKARFSVATNESRKVGDKWTDYTEWHTVEVFGGLVAVVRKHIKKGTTLQVRGKMEYGQYEKTVGKGKSAETVTMRTATIRAETLDIDFSKKSSEEE